MPAAGSGSSCAAAAAGSWQQRRPLAEGSLTRTPLPPYPTPSAPAPPPPPQVRCLVDVPGGRLPSDLPQYLREHVAPEVPDSLRAAFLAAVEGGAIRSMQNKQLTSKPLHQPGALLLGDSFNMRHPLTGGGMTVALSDTRLLCDMLQVGSAGPPLTPPPQPPPPALLAVPMPSCCPGHCVPGG